MNDIKISDIPRKGAKDKNIEGAKVFASLQIFAAWRAGKNVK